MILDKGFKIIVLSFCFVMKDILKELYWRGLLSKSTLVINEQFKKEDNTIYGGFDPTSDSLHIGNLLPLFMLEHFNRFDYKTLTIIGGATAMIGDPAGKHKERTLLDKEILRHNMQCIQKQADILLNVNVNVNVNINININKSKSKLLNNYDWIGKISFLNFVRDIGKTLTVKYMMAKDSVRSRLKAEGISFTEFTYQLLQAYDFYHLFTHENCRLQIGGSDQWGNIITGIDLIRKITGNTAHGIASPIVSNYSGTKFGKSDNNENIWLDYRRTSPYIFYQFWLNLSDKESSLFIKFYTFFKKEEINQILYYHYKYPYKRILQKTLAKNMTKCLHGEKNYKKYLKLSNLLFGKYSIRSLASLNEKTLLTNVHRVLLKRGSSIIEALTENSVFFSSKGETRRALKEKALHVNREKVNEKFVFNDNSIIENRYILLQKGKKYYLILEGV